MEVAIIIILAVAVLMLVWGVSTTARKLRLFEQKCKDQDEELTKLRWENSELQQKIEEYYQAIGDEDGLEAMLEYYNDYDALYQLAVEYEIIKS